MAKPTLKWPGGKRDLIEVIIEQFPNNYNTYHEPFIGAGALFFHIEPNKGSINDTNTRLINYYEEIRDNPEDVISYLKEFNDPESDPIKNQEYSETNRKGKEIKNYYYQIREHFNKRPNDENFNCTREAAMLQYLNRTCFNGLYRENNSGEFNSPIGRYENPDWTLEKRVREASDVLNGINIFNNDFSYITDVAEPNDIVYLDPPYKPTSKTASFTEYSEGKFGEEKQMELVDIVRELDDNNINFVLSNSAIMHDEYDKYFEVQYVMGDRSISCKSDGRGEVKEILVSNN